MENIENLSLSDKAIIDAYNKGYRISKNGKTLNPDGKEIGFNDSKSGYKIFKFRFENKSRPIKAHRLQAYQKFGNKIFDNIIVRHLNGNFLDNSWDNIELGTNKENQFDIPLSQRIKNTKNSTQIRQKYSNELIIYIRHCYVTGKNTQSQLSDKFGISKSGIHHILNNLYLFERIESDNIINKKPDLEKFRNIQIDEINSEDIDKHINKKHTNNKYSDEFCRELKELHKTLTYQELSDKFDISKGMITYLCLR